MKEKVKFVNKSDQAFFECSTAEARIAIKAVEDSRISKLIKGKSLRIMNVADIRDDDNVLVKQDDIKLELEGIFDDVSSTPVLTMGYEKDGLDATIIASMFKAVETRNVIVSHLFMSASRYADLRERDRECINVETKKWKLQAGWMASIWGAKIVVRRDFPDDEVMAMSAQEYRANKAEDVVVRWRLEFYGKPPVAKDDVPARLDVIEGLLEEIKAIRSKG